LFRSTQTERGFFAPLPPFGFGVAAADARDALEDDAEPLAGLDEAPTAPAGEEDAPAGDADVVAAGTAVAAGGAAGGAALALLAAGAGGPFFFTNFESFGKGIAVSSSAGVPEPSALPQRDAAWLGA
jgi:hypothetical protein